MKLFQENKFQLNNLHKFTSCKVYFPVYLIIRKYLKCQLLKLLKLVWSKTSKASIWRTRTIECRKRFAGIFSLNLAADTSLDVIPSCLVIYRKTLVTTPKIRQLHGVNNSESLIVVFRNSYSKFKPTMGKLLETFLLAFPFDVGF